MSCFNVKRQSSAYLDARLRAAERSKVTAHLRRCESCASHLEQLTVVQSSLKAMPREEAPAGLTTALRVIASRERQAVLATHGSRWASLWARWKFRIDMLMRPVTVPATGGILSSFILFVTLAFTIGTTTRVVGYEVPLLYESRPDANLVPIELRSKTVMLSISLDSDGRIRDYSVGDGSYSIAGNLATLQYNSIAMPKFPSVLALAHPISGDVRILFTPLALRP